MPRVEIVPVEAELSTPGWPAKRKMPLFPASPRPPNAKPPRWRESGGEPAGEHGIDSETGPEMNRPRDGAATGCVVDD